MAQAIKSKKRNAAGLKMAITVTSVVATIGAWAGFSAHDVNTAQADQSQQQTPAVAQSPDSSNNTPANPYTPGQGRTRRGHFGSTGPTGTSDPSQETTFPNSDLGGQSSLPGPITRSQSSR